MAKLAAAFSSLTLLLAFALLVASEECVYEIHLKTGDVKDAGTDANVKLGLYDAQGQKVEVGNLWYHGIMESGHDYFERNNLDLFSFPGRCLQVCRIDLGHDNRGSKPGWYVDYLVVNTHYNDGRSTRKSFDIYQWLASDEPPNYSTVLKKDQCGNNKEPYIQFRYGGSS